MTDQDDQHRRKLLRAYLLGTLEEDAQRHVAERLESDAEWRDALEAEHAALEALDALPEVHPPPGLAAATIARTAEPYKKRRVVSPWAVLGWSLAAAVVLALAVPIYESVQTDRRESLAAANLKQIGIAMKMYVNDSVNEMYPPLAPYEDVWIFDVETLYPEYLKDLTLLASPRLPDYEERVSELAALQDQDPIDWERVSRIAAESYTYLGYMVTDTRDIRNLAQERTQLARAGTEGIERVDEDEGHILRLREGIERFLITDINNPGASSRQQSEILLLMETPPPSSEPADSFVLYLDGHVERSGPYASRIRDAVVRQILRPEP